jgi:hypothetical protein
MDQLKQELREMYAGEGKGQLAEDALKSVHAGVRQAIGNASPEYNDLMGGYQRILDDLQDATNSAGASDKTAATTQLQRLVRAQKTPEGQTLSPVSANAIRRSHTCWRDRPCTIH